MCTLPVEDPGQYWQIVLACTARWQVEHSP
jgi:hypothetical protein